MHYKDKLGFGFEIAKGSEGFYKTWIPRTFDPKISPKLFAKIDLAKNTNNPNRLTGFSCEFTYENISQHSNKANIEKRLNETVKKNSIDSSQKLPAKNLLSKSMQPVIRPQNDPNYPQPSENLEKNINTKQKYNK